MKPRLISFLILDWGLFLGGAYFIWWLSGWGFEHNRILQIGFTLYNVLHMLGDQKMFDMLFRPNVSRSSKLS